MGGIFARRGIRSHRSGPEARELPVSLDRLSFFVPSQLLEDGLRAAGRVSRGLAKQGGRLASRLGGDLPRLGQGNLLLKRVARGPAVWTRVRHRPRFGHEAAHVALDLRDDVDRIDAGHHGDVLRARPGHALEPRKLVLLAVPELLSVYVA